MASTLRAGPEPERLPDRLISLDGIPMGWVWLAASSVWLAATVSRIVRTHRILGAAPAAPASQWRRHVNQA